MPNIHPTAIVEDGAELHESVEIGPFCIVETGAVIGAGCRLESHIRIYGSTHMGANNHIGHGSAIGAAPQDHSYSPELGKPLTIGDGNTFRESVNIGCGLKSEAGTQIGNGNYFMTSIHVGHDCVLGDNNTLANGATLSGHVEIDHHVFVSGLTAMHQFSRLGSYSMLSGNSAITKDVPPFVIADGHRAEVVGLNVVGLRRNGFDQARRTTIKRAYRTIYQSGLKLAEALESLRNEDPTEDVRSIIRFVETSRRGILSHR